jgi:glycosyltransferase involved in cell wall biosynthesis
LRVAHVVLSLELGGLERLVTDLVRVGMRRGQQVSVICLEKPGTLADQVTGLGAPLLCMRKEPGIRPSTTVRVRDALRELRPDVVHTHQIGALFYAGPAARQAGVPAVVHTEHVNQIAKLLSRTRRCRMRLLWGVAGRFAHRFLGVSADIAREVVRFRTIPRRKVGVVLNGIDTAAFVGRTGAARVRSELGIPAGAPVIGSVGRLNEVKRQDLLIRSFARVRHAVPDARLVLVGSGPALGSLRSLTAELGLNGCVHFAGYQPRPEVFLQIMDLFALTSRIEGLPLAILEAWAAGLPVVASAVGGVPALIDSGRTGLLFPSGDEDALTDALTGLLSDRDRARRLGGAGLDEVRAHYSLERMADEYERHYSELLARAGARVAVAC